MKTIEITLNGETKSVVNLDNTQNVGKGQRAVNTRINYLVNLDSILINAGNIATRNFIFDCIKSLMNGSASCVYDDVDFKGEEDYTACENDFETDQTVGLLYYDKEQEKMYKAMNVAHNTIDNEKAKDVVNFTFVPSGETPDTSDAEDGDLFYLEDDSLFYEWDADNEELAQTTADTTKIYLSDDKKVYSYENEVLQIIADCIVLENATQDDWDELEVGSFVCDSDNMKYGEVVETEVLELVEYELNADKLYSDTKDSNKLYFVVDSVLAEFESPVDSTDFANGHLIVETI